jgi:hypothetical protein
VVRSFAQGIGASLAQLIIAEFRSQDVQGVVLPDLGHRRLPSGSFRAFARDSGRRHVVVGNYDDKFIGLGDIFGGIGWS